MRFYDNTRVSAYRRCPRFFMLRHIFHWTSSRTSIALANGSGWHAAMDVIWNKGTIEEAVDAWTTCMLEENFDVSSDSLHDMNFNSMYTREVTRTRLKNYVSHYKNMLNSVKVISTEQPFAVPLNQEGIYYVGRFDKIIEDQRKAIRIIEHKTSSSYKKNGPFKQTFIDSFSPNSQIDGYLYAGSLLYGDKFRGIFVDAALIHKEVYNGFTMIPIEKKFEMVDAWLHETKHWVDEIRYQYGSLTSSKEYYASLPFLTIFPRRTEECSSYSGCIFRDICRYVANPMKLEGPPEGFIVKKWSPFETVGLKKLGLRPEE